MTRTIQVLPSAGGWAVMFSDATRVLAAFRNQTDATAFAESIAGDLRLSVVVQPSPPPALPRDASASELEEPT